MKLLNKALGATVLVLGMSANLASAAQVTISEHNYGGGIIVETLDAVLDDSQAGSFSMTVSENHFTVSATDSNGRRFSCRMNGIVTYDKPNLLEKVTNIASAFSAGDRVQIETQKGVLPQTCHVKKLLNF
ncbi:hypothetical protein JF50_25375 [Pseudoalteromonas luteoviolacea]|uniref:DUF5666 domain-containing protein n=1 Tax=Pseudoalteromonas luteoviolacea TaxID=43657 RepID=A0A0C1Q3H3_9GAMM|nr:hypothetical protein [Pseudoalteromonas luteoviolacea]KID55136.1 hypothetical protein JF50_25375 [Pseudoalteromonas luteoviolacea]